MGQYPSYKTDKWEHNKDPTLLFRFTYTSLLFWKQDRSLRSKEEREASEETKGKPANKRSMEQARLARKEQEKLSFMSHPKLLLQILFSDMWSSP